MVVVKSSSSGSEAAQITKLAVWIDCIIIFQPQTVIEEYLEISLVKGDVERMPLAVLYVRLIDRRQRPLVWI